MFSNQLKIKLYESQFIQNKYLKRNITHGDEEIYNENKVELYNQ